MAQVSIKNINRYPLVTRFKGDVIKIMPGASIEMEALEANEFKGQYHPRVFDGDGNDDPRGYKMLEIVPIGSGGKVEPPKPVKIPCHACVKQFDTNDELSAHIDENHLDQLQDPEVAAERKMELAEMPRRRGRPPREKNGAA